MRSHKYVRKIRLTSCYHELAPRYYPVPEQEVRTTFVSVSHVQQQFGKFLLSADSSGVVAKLVKAVFT